MAFAGQLMDIIEDIKMGSAQVLFCAENITQPDCQALAADGEKYEEAAQLLLSIEDQQTALIEDMEKVRDMLGLTKNPMYKTKKEEEAAQK